MNLEIKAKTRFCKEIGDIAADKSISHRCAIFALLSNRDCEVRNYLRAEDTLDTLNIAKQLGLGVQETGDTLRLSPPDSIKEPSDVLYCGNAGTAMRLYAGLLSGMRGYFVLSGDKYLNNRPMKRIVRPLQGMGAKIYARDDNFAPLSVIGAKLCNFDYKSDISSAQVKSALILAKLFGQGRNHFSEPLKSRDHTERMLSALGVKFYIQESTEAYSFDFDSIEDRKLESFSLDVPADPSSAFYFALAALVVPESNVLLKNVLLNSTRIEAFMVLERMGAKIKIYKKHSDIEEIGDIEVSYAPLQSVKLDRNISWLIDEIPALAIAFAIAKGKSEVRNASELRVKESDRIKATLAGLRAMGIECEEYEDGFSVVGGELKKARVESFSDHRIAMSFAIAGLASGVEIVGSECMNVSFPKFFDILQSL